MRSPWHTKRRTVVVDLGRVSAKLAVAETAAEAVRFHGITRIALPQPQEGRARADAAEIARRIGEVVRRRGWQGMRAACLLSGSATSTQSFLFPSMPDADLRQAIALKLRETLHFDLEEACVDFRRVLELGEHDKRRCLVLGAAARKDAVMHALAVLRQAGLEPVAVGAAAESLANLSLAAGLCREGEATIHACIGSDLTVFNLFDGNVLRFSREVDSAGEAFTQALMRPILTARGPVQLSHAQAEEVKMLAGYPVETGEGGEDEELELPHGVSAEDILPLLEPVAQRISAELSRSVDYLCGLLGRTSIDRILLSGPAGRMRNLDVMLEERLGTPVSFSDPVSRAMSHWRLAIRDADAPDPAGFSAILGYSLGNRQPINLLPREERARQVARRVARVCRSSAPVTVSLALALVGAAVPIRRTYSDAKSSLEATVAELDERIREETALGETLASLSASAQRVASARGLVPDWAGVLKELSHLLPDGMEITAFDMGLNGDVPSIKIRVRIQGEPVPLEVTSAQVIAALAASPFFLDVHVRQASLDLEGPEGHFEAELDVAAPRSATWGNGS
jgi:type IV pilus assembly protein PilM